MEERLKKLINETSYIYDLEDTAEWIMYNKEELLKVLQEGVNAKEDGLAREIRVDFFKPCGKWYSGGNVEVSHHLFEDEFKQDIVDNQNILHDGWQGNYTVVTDNIGDDPYFAKAVFDTGEFLRFKKTV